MGFRDTLKDLINGIREKDGNDMNNNEIDKAVAELEAAENRKWRKELEVSVGGDNKGNKSALKEKVKQTENVKTNNSPKETKKGQPKRMKGRNEDIERGD